MGEPLQRAPRQAIVQHHSFSTFRSFEFVSDFDIRISDFPRGYASRSIWMV